MTGRGEPRVSVVIPCYNQAHFLADAIESAVGQRDVVVDAIVVDDGSTDATARVASRYPGVQLVRQPNHGLSRARNAGSAVSRGDYVVFLDADDRLLPGGLAAGSRALATHPDCGLVFGHHRRIDAGGAPLPTPREPCVARDPYELLLRMNYISAPASAMFRRGVLNALGGFDPANDAAGDYDLYLRTARRFPIRCHHAEVAEYRRHDGNMTRNAALMLRATLAALAAQRDRARSDPRYRAALEAGIAFAVTYYGSRLAARVHEHVGERRWRAAVVALLGLLRHCPGHLVRAAARRAGPRVNWRAADA